jgi:hypothetical protein
MVMTMKIFKFRFVLFLFSLLISLKLLAQLSVDSEDQPEITRKPSNQIFYDDWSLRIGPALVNTSFHTANTLTRINPGLGIQSHMFYHLRNGKTLGNNMQLL